MIELKKKTQNTGVKRIWFFPRLGQGTLLALVSTSEKKVDNMHEKITKFSIEMETIEKESVEIHKWKTVTEVKNSFDGLIPKLKTAEEKLVNLKIGQ